MSYPCRQCGACCHLQDIAPALLQALGFKTKEDGTCQHLAGTTCSTYETRPWICRIPDSRYEQNAVRCNVMLAGLGRTDFITLEEIARARQNSR